MRNLLLYLHVAGAVVLMGELLFASLWLRSAMARAPGPGLLRYTLATMQWTSRSFALPAILVNLVTGFALLHVARIPFATRWIVSSLVLYVVVTGLWHGMLIPTRRKLAAMLEGGAGDGSGPQAGALPAGFVPMAKRWVSVSALVLLLLFAILALMVWKPAI